jgi:hypothetical protein
MAESLTVDQVVVGSTPIRHPYIDFSVPVLLDSWMYKRSRQLIFVSIVFFRELLIRCLLILFQNQNLQILFLNPAKDRVSV